MVKKKLDLDNVYQHIDTLRTEIALLSAKKPNDPVNKFKLKYINQTISDSNEILGAKKPYESFDTFSEDDLPTNSDVLMMLSLYYSALYDERNRY